MAVGIERLERKLDRLEKFFSKKRKGTRSSNISLSESSSRPPSPLSARLDADGQQFPWPSFIRPTSSRMIAREEAALGPSPTRRTKSLPDSSNSQHPMSLNIRATSVGTVTRPAFTKGVPQIPPRVSSLAPGIPQGCTPQSRGPGKTVPVSQLLEFSFPAASVDGENNTSSSFRSRSNSRSGPRSLSPSTSVSVSPKTRKSQKRNARRAHDETPISQLHKLDAKGSSVPQFDFGWTSMQQESQPPGSAQHQSAASKALSREISLPGTRRAGMGNGNSMKCPRPKSLYDSGTLDKLSHASLRKSVSLSDVDSILKEPSLTEVMKLSEDDIADHRLTHRTKTTAPNLPARSLSHDLPAAARGPQTVETYQLLMPSPPLASRPTTVAALEAARIAVKFGFDLVYIVKLWPGRTGYSKPQLALKPSYGLFPPARPSPHSFPGSNELGKDTLGAGAVPSLCNSSGCGMSGRLLAAYGLPSIMCPFQISVPVHQKVLRTEGWLEYRSENAGTAMDEFARGYSCSFYTGHIPERRCGKASPDSKIRMCKETARAEANCGIVFAAYRLPSKDGADVGCNAAQLAEVHKEAQALVDMLLDVRRSMRKRRAAAAASPKQPTTVPSTTAAEAVHRTPPCQVSSAVDNKRSKESLVSGTEQCHKPFPKSIPKPSTLRQSAQRAAIATHSISRLYKAGMMNAFS